MEYTLSNIKLDCHSIFSFRKCDSRPHGLLEVDVVVSDDAHETLCRWVAPVAPHDRAVTRHLVLPAVERRRILLLPGVTSPVL